MKTTEATVEFGGAVIFVQTYSEEYFVPTSKVVKYSVGRTSSGHFWMLQLELVDRGTVCFGQYEDYDSAFKDLRELLGEIYGKKPEEYKTKCEI